jgi:hypothetical protein
VEHAAEEVVQDAKKDIALALFPDLDASLLWSDHEQVSYLWSCISLFF